MQYCSFSVLPFYATSTHISRPFVTRLYLSRKIFNVKSLDCGKTNLLVGYFLLEQKFCYNKNTCTQLLLKVHVQSFNYEEQSVSVFSFNKTCYQTNTVRFLPEHIFTINGNFFNYRDIKRNATITRETRLTVTEVLVRETKSSY